MAKSKSTTRLCKNCKQAFTVTAKHPNAKLCSRQCGAHWAAKVRKTKTWSAKARKQIGQRNQVWWRAQRQQRTPELNDYAWLRERYVCRQLSAEEIVTELQTCSRSAVYRALRRHNLIGQRPRRQRGKHHPNWKGDAAKDEAKWLRAIGTLEDPGRCEMCNAANNLVWHHIWPRRHNGEHSRANLVRCCRRCHAELDQIFQKLAEESFVSAGCPGLDSAAMTYISTAMSSGTKSKAS